MADQEKQVEPLCGLNYWINSKVQVPNPCAILRGRALWLDGSNWLIRRSQFPHAAFARLQRMAGGELGMRYWINEFAPSAQQGLLEQAAHALRIKLQGLVSELTKSVETANTKLGADDATWRIRQTQEKNRVAAVKRCRKSLKELEQAAKTYGLPLDGFRFEGVRAYAQALERGQYRQTNEIAKLAEMAKGTEMEAAANADEVPPEILADFIEDRGGDVTAVRIALGQIEAQEMREQAVSIIQQLDAEREQDAIENDHGDTREPSVEEIVAPPIEGTWARLSDGTWGARLTVQALEGDEATLVRSNGNRQLVRLVNVETRFRHRNVTIWRIEVIEEQVVETPVPVVEQPKPVPVVVAAAKPDVTTRTLIRGAWSIAYVVNCETAMVIRSFQSEGVETMKMSREDARNHYAAAIAQGYKDLAAF